MVFAAYVFTILVSLPFVLAAQKPPAYLQRAADAAAQGRWKDVITLTKTAERDKQAPALALTLRALAMLETGNAQGGLSAAIAAITRDSSVKQAWLLASESAMRLNRSDTALQFLASAIRRFPDDAAVLQTYGLALARRNECDRAIAPLEDAMFRRPDNVGVVLQLAQCYERLNRFAEAATLFERVLEIRPSDANARIGLADAYMKQERFSDAVPLYSRLVTEGRDTPTLTIALAAALSGSGQHQKAIDALQPLAVKRPDDADVVYNIALAFAATARPDSAMRYFRRAVQLRPTFPQALYHLALAQDDAGFADDALRTLQRCALQNPAMAPMCYFRSAEVLRAANRLEEAIEMHDQCLALTDTVTTYVASKGHTLFLLDRTSEAIAFLESYLQKVPNDADLSHAVARHYIKAGRTEEAKKIIERLDSTHRPLADQLRNQMK
jgi:tetratricopeptide (TPR) repeat protein